MPKVFIDGQEGTTGLQIYERLGGRQDIQLLHIDDSLRKDAAARRQLINQADLVFLCLPDAAAREAVALADSGRVRFIDASTAHRTDPEWVYGFPELRRGQREKIRAARLVANPGCHATGFLAVTAPLVQMGILPEDSLVMAWSLTGYSGGGKKMIAEYEAPGRDKALNSPRIYGLNLHHKHLPEMTLYAGLKNQPVFSPIVDDYYCGMQVTLPLHNSLLRGHQTAQTLRDALAGFYEGEKLITVAPLRESGMLAANDFAGQNGLEISVSGNESQTIVTARFDNLGKGASGAAVQNMNIMLGFEETAGLL